MKHAIYSYMASLPDTADRLYFQMRLIRCAEEKLLALFSEGRLSGTTHTSIGQEANAVAFMNAIDRDKDVVWSNHRCHGHFIAYCGNLPGLFAEIMGLEHGVCGGRGGSQHLCHQRFYSSGIQGGIAPQAVGAAYALKDDGAVALVFIGDGTLGQGALYESLNMASLWQCPAVFVVENNAIAQTTPAQLAVSGQPEERARSFGIDCYDCDSTDVIELSALAAEVVSAARARRRPAWVHLHTVRLGPHSKGDDTRAPEEIERLRQRDPLLLQRARSAQSDAIDLRCVALVEQAVEQALRGEVPA